MHKWKKLNFSVDGWSNVHNELILLTDVTTTIKKVNI